MTVFAAPGTSGSIVAFAPAVRQLDRRQAGRPVQGQYFENVSPVNGKPFCEIARSTAEDIELALDAAHAAAPAWGKTSAANAAMSCSRSPTGWTEPGRHRRRRDWDNGKPVRETLAADIRWRSTTSATSPGAARPRGHPVATR